MGEENAGFQRPIGRISTMLGIPSVVFKSQRSCLSLQNKTVASKEGANAIVRQDWLILRLNDQEVWSSRFPLNFGLNYYIFS